ncbi:MAG: crotonase/enoyl-CoA hydratase family protein [Acidimicrobiales bacterium]|nr:crotonase/enoyl-CoA hydratase family protein [Acidimicrobiales bacterium]MCB9392486.1 crotonase/enoyl-CoA hydratase family protein [Acidimicrobiaceae bacterium]
MTTDRSAGDATRRQELSLRDLEPSDTEAVRALVLAGLADHWGEVDPTLNCDLDDLAAAYPGSRTVVAVDGTGAIVATGTVVPRGDGVAEVVRMSVAADRRGQGHGRSVLDELLATAQAWGAPRVVLETTSSWTDVVAFYEHAGFRRTHVAVGEFGEDTWFERVDETGPMDDVMATTAATVRTEALDGGVWVVTIDRPEVRNAVDGPTAALLAAAFREFAARDDLRVAVLTGAGGTFCAGADLKAVGAGHGNRVDADVSFDGPMGPTRMWLDKPVVAAVEGHAVAGGLELAVWCDLRVAAADAVFGVYCRRWGVPLVDGGTIRLSRLLGHSHALDLILTGRGVSGEEALRMGLANRLVEPGQALEAAIELARQIGEFPQLCLRGDRRSSYDQWSMPIDDALAHETEIGLATIRSGETLAGARRFAGGEGRHGSF